MPTAPLHEIRSKIGEEIGVSDWLTIDQKRIDEFADATDDHQFIHVDPEAARATPFGVCMAPPIDSAPLMARMLDRTAFLLIRRGAPVATSDSAP